MNDSPKFCTLVSVVTVGSWGLGSWFAFYIPFFGALTRALRESSPLCGVFLADGV